MLRFWFWPEADTLPKTVTSTQSVPPEGGTRNGTWYGTSSSKVGAGSDGGRSVAGNVTKVRGSTTVGFGPSLVANVVDAWVGSRDDIDSFTSMSLLNPG